MKTSRWINTEMDTMIKAFLQGFIICVLISTNSKAISSKLKSTENCTYKSETEITTTARIDKISIVDEYSEDYIDRLRQCHVRMEVLINKKWHKVTGDYIYNFDLSEQEGCNIARKIGIQEYIKNNFANIVDDLEIMVCKEEKGIDSQGIAIKKKDDQDKSTKENVEEWQLPPEKKLQLIEKILNFSAFSFLGVL